MPASEMHRAHARGEAMRLCSTTSAVSCFALLAVLACACAPHAVRGPSATELTSAYAPSAYGDTGGAGDALHAGDYGQALFLANRATRELPRDPWARYQRAVALEGLGETDLA